MVHKFKKTLTVVLLLFAVLFGQWTWGWKTRTDNREIAIADGFTETAERLTNPDRGFYKSIGITLTGEEDGTALFSAAHLKSILAEVDGCSLLHLRIDLAAFSSNGVYYVGEELKQGKTGDIPEKTLQSLGNTFAEIRKTNGTAIVRFSYNQRGLEDENGYLNAEPDSSAAIPTIRRHIGQVAEVLAEYQDLISSIETGMIGPWGEQHSTALAGISDQKTLYYNLVEAWLSTKIQDVNFSVRRPLFYRHWANKKYNLGLTDKDMGISDGVLSAHPDLARVGVFNDAYLGSSSDMGTYTNRAAETEWLNVAAKNVLFGGEAVVDTKTGGIGNYNRAAYAIYESGIVHTAYLNRNWNERVIGSQRGEDLSGSWETVAYSSLQDELKNLGVFYDPLYKDKTAYDYIADHMGYRLVLKSAGVAVKGNKLELTVVLKNVGFGNVIKRQTARLLFADETGVVDYCTADIDVREIEAGETRTFHVELNAPSLLSEGNDYSVYLKLGSAFDSTASTGAGTSLRTIAFANRDCYDARLGANKLCLFTFEEGAQTRPYVTYCERTPLVNSDGQFSVERSESGVETVRIADSGSIEAYAESTLSGHTAEAYPYIILDYESEADFSLSVYYDTGMHCITYRKILPKGRHTVVYRTVADMKTLRLYVAHGQSGIEGQEIKFHGVEVASHCVLKDRSTQEKRLAYYTDGQNYYGADEIVYPNGAGDLLFTPTYISLQTTGAGLRLLSKTAFSGIRFATGIDRAEYEALTEIFGAENIETGTLIFPTEYIGDLNAFTVEELQRVCKKRGVALADIKNDGWNQSITTEESVAFYGSLVRLHKANYDRAFTGVGYLTIHYDGKSITVLSAFEHNSYCVQEMAREILLDKTALDALTAEERSIVEEYAA